MGKRVTPHCERLIKRLNKQHSDFASYYEKAISILIGDPHNRTRSYQIKKLESVRPPKPQPGCQLS